jgi:hypothetical protein
VVGVHQLVRGLVGLQGREATQAQAACVTEPAPLEGIACYAAGGLAHLPAAH